MKVALVLTAFALVMSGCAHQSHSPRTVVYVVHGARPDADNSQSWHPKAFKVGEQRFGTIEEFKAFIAALPSGSVVHWDSGCIRYAVIPLAHSSMSIADFKDYCGQHGVRFEYVVSGY
jgi:hypothetical protein